MLSASNGISCPNCFHGALGDPSRAQRPHGPKLRVVVRPQMALFGVLGMDDSTRSTLAAGGLLLAAVGLGFAIWKSEHTPKPRRRRRRRFATSF
jgi:hypothetical protein